MLNRSLIMLRDDALSRSYTIATASSKMTAARMLRPGCLVVLLVSFVCCVFGLPAPPSLLPAFTNLPYNYNVTGASLSVISGTVPSWLSGSLYRNGPGMFPNVTRPHWFDGLAFLQAYHFSNGEITFDCSFVGSSSYNSSAPGNDETSNVEVSEFSPSYLDTSLKTDPRTGFVYSPNTGVTIQEVGGLLLTSTATTLCNQFDPITTGNIAEPYTWPDTIPFMPSPEHRKRDPTGDYYHFGYDVLPPYGYLLYKIPSGTTVRQSLSLLPPATNINYQHSYSLTENYIVLTDQPVPLPHSFDWNAFILAPGVPCVWRVIEKTTGTEAFRFESEGFMFFHTIHAYETKTNSIIVDLIQYPDATIMQALFLDQILHNTTAVLDVLNKGAPYRYELPLSQPNSTIVGKMIQQIPLELPVVSPLVGVGEYLYSYSIGLSSLDAVFFDLLVKLNGDTGETLKWTSPGCFPGEPIFVSKPHHSSAPAAEDDGLLLSVVLDGVNDASFLLILDAKTFDEIARVAAPRSMPLGFHGLYAAPTPSGFEQSFIAEK